MLQWGHGDEAVEEWQQLRHRSNSFWLQWGHGDEAVEELKKLLAYAKKLRLQWGHGDEAVEERIDNVAIFDVVLASMGPRR